jgi:hypothetical protein
MARSTSTDFACTTGTRVQIAKVAGVWRVRVVDLAGEIVLDAQVTPFGGTASYTKSYCGAGISPLLRHAPAPRQLLRNPIWERDRQLLEADPRARVPRVRRSGGMFGRS